MTNKIDEDFDFGFSAVSEAELKALEKQLQSQLKSQELENSQIIQQVTQTYEEKLNSMYKLIMPLLKNLANDDNKEYIYWPNRVVKMKEFIAKINALMK